MAHILSVHILHCGDETQIVEAFAEHDFRLKRLIGMVCIMELVRFLLALLPAQRKVWQPSLC